MPMILITNHARTVVIWRGKLISIILEHNLAFFGLIILTEGDNEQIYGHIRIHN